MMTFTWIAAGLALIAVAWLCWPLFRAGTEERRMPSLVLVAALVPAAAFGMYLKTTNWDWQAAAAAGPSVQEQLNTLRDAAENSPGSVDRWMALGAGYAATDRWPEAADAYRQAWALSGRNDPRIGLEFAMALSNADASTLTGEAAPLIERALAASPDAPRALWLGGLLAARQGNPPLARERWERLLALNPPPAVAELVRMSIDVLEGGKTGEGAAPTPAGTADGVEVAISLSPQAAASVPSDGVLFVLARDPTQPGPPFAARRLSVGDLPLRTRLSDADAMLPGRTLSTAKELVVVARVSRSGQPTAASGDWYGEAAWQPSGTDRVEIVIDKRVQ